MSEFSYQSWHLQKTNTSPISLVQELCTPRPLRLPLGFALGQPLRPRGKIPAFWKYCDPPIPTPPKTIIPNEPTAAKNPNHQPNHTTPPAPKWVPIWGPFSEFGSPKGPHFFQGPHYIPFQAEECDKSQSSHYLLNVDNLNTCDDKTSLNLYTCTPNEATLFEGVFPHFFLLCISKKLARLDKFSKIAFCVPICAGKGLH